MTVSVVFVSACRDGRAVDTTPGSTLVLAASPSAVIGDDASASLFGRVDELVVDDRGRIFVLDARTQRISVFNASGEFTGSAGRAGRGPGEFMVPRAMGLILSGKALLVHDAALRRVQEFRTGEAKLAFVRSTPIDADVDDFCTFDDGFATVGLDQDGLVHTYNLAGERVTSFGHGFRQSTADPPRMVDGLSNSVLLCLSRERMIVVASRLLPEFRAYSRDGRLLWKSEISGFKRTKVFMQGKALVYRSGDEGTHSVTDLWLINDSIAGLQMSFLPTRVDHPPEHYDTRLFNVRTGAEVGHQSDLPHIANTTSSRAFSVDDDLVVRAFPYSIRTR